MSEIENRVELPGYKEPQYGKATKARSPEEYRGFVGGMWDEMGKLQEEFLVGQGLRPSDRFLDVGCGSLRAGVRLVDFLEPGHYHGIDISHQVLVAGHQHELTQQQRERLPAANLRATDRFDADFGVPFDMAIAQSLFTHISLNHIRLCLFRVAKVMRGGGKFFATFNERPANHPLDSTQGKRYSERNVFWQYRADLAWAASFSPWEFRYIGDWGHPRGQVMVEFTRLQRRGRGPRTGPGAKAGAQPDQ